MVGRDMTVRLRSGVALVGVLAVLLLTGGVTSMHDVVEHRAEHAAVVVKTARTAPAAALRLPLAGFALAAAVTFAIARARGSRVAHLHLRRIDDDGERWRALLFGAPPVLA
jgi:hypothetical protein